MNNGQAMPEQGRFAAHHAAPMLSAWPLRTKLAGFEQDISLFAFFVARNALFAASIRTFHI